MISHPSATLLEKNSTLAHLESSRCEVVLLDEHINMFLSGQRKIHISGRQSECTIEKFPGYTGPILESMNGRRVVTGAYSLIDDFRNLRYRYISRYGDCS